MSKKREYPKPYSKFYFVEVAIDGTVDVPVSHWTGHDWQKRAFDSGNFFTAKTRALAAKRKLQKAIAEVFKH